MPSQRPLVTGTLFALAAGAMWGLVFVAPTLLHDYPPALLAFGRYVAFGLIALPLAWLDRSRIAGLSRGDWIEAAKLALVGNIAYYLLLAAAIQRAGGPLPTMIIGTLPVVIAVASKLRASPARALRDGDPAWRRMLPSLLLIGAGIVLVHTVEWRALRERGAVDAVGYATGALMAVGAAACWTWYPIRNADWLRDHPGRSPGTWATAQGLATLPWAAAGYAGWWAWTAAATWPASRGAGRAAEALASTGGPFPMPFGPRPMAFIGLMLLIGLSASWLGTLCWNQASQRLPPHVAGQLIVFETLAALVYAYVLRGRPPDAATLAGAALLVAGVAWALGAGRRASPHAG